jgi:3-isopropylmalate/(R)-2-methylmalate dehydratase small subunit
MQPFTTCTGRAVPLRRSNIDTDQIIPSRYLKGVTRSGFGKGLFAAWRAGSGFVLDDPAYASATVLLAGPNFGTGSSREQAVWALQDWGFRAIIAPRFGDIFLSNALKNGLLAVVLPANIVEALMAGVEAEPSTEVTVDLERREVRSDELLATFDLDEYARARLIEGLDDIALTLQHQSEIAAYESGRPTLLPRTLPL